MGETQEKIMSYEVNDYTLCCKFSSFFHNKVVTIMNDLKAT